VWANAYVPEIKMTVVLSGMIQSMGRHKDQQNLSLMKQMIIHPGCFYVIPIHRVKQYMCVVPAAFGVLLSSFLLGSR
jgi:hypothetical protein